jgi:lipoteichoic acid synthase
VNACFVIPIVALWHQAGENRQMMCPRRRSKNTLGRLAPFVLPSLILLAGAAHAGSAVGNSDSRAALTTVTVRYLAPQASVVDIVWGLDDWQALPEENRPPGTVMQENLMYTRLRRNNTLFHIDLVLPMASTLDFGFLIQNALDGSVVGVWDPGAKLEIGSGGQRSTIELESNYGSAALESEKAAMTKKLIRPATLSIALMIMLLVFLRSHLMRSATVGTNAAILGIGLALATMLIIIRGLQMGFELERWRHLPIVAVRSALASYQDIWLTAILTIGALAVGWAASRSKLLSRGVVCVFGLVAVVTIFAAALNIRIVEMLGGPFTYQWLYYSDFLDSPEAKSAIAENMTSQVNLLALFAICSMLAGAWLAAGLVASAISGRRVFFVPVVAIAIGFFFFPFAEGFADRMHWKQSQLANPVVAFLSSAMDRSDSVRIFDMEVPEKFLSQNIARETSEPVAGTEAFVRDPRIKNVVVFVLESVPAKYIQSYGGNQDVTPNLTRYGGMSLQYENIYAHAPATNKALMSLLTSSYPWVSYHSLTDKNPELPMDSLSSVLQENDYQTLFVSSADNRFQRGDEFLEIRGFDTIVDQRSLVCENRGSTSYRHLDSADELCIVDHFLNWAESVDENDSLFAMLWSASTHYPYWSFTEEVDFGVQNETFNRYLNALRNTDQAIGNLLDGLSRTGRLESTLVVVVGDHGEAFRQHGQTGHATHLYEENVRVPFILINPLLFSGTSNTQIGGLVDVAPTIADIVGAPEPESWQGRSLRGNSGNGRTYFFCPWSDFLFGMRDGDYKLIYNATMDEYELYDIASDPGETINLSGQIPTRVDDGIFRLAAWVQNQDSYWKNLGVNSR